MDRQYIAARILILFIQFFKNTWGSVQSPYITYRRLSKGGEPLQIIPIYLVSIGYFGWSSLVHLGLSSHPYQLSFSFGTLVFAASATYVLVLFSLVQVSRAVGGSGSVRTVLLPWTYSLIPTLVWFFITSVMTLLFPPPRTMSLLGQIFSFLFISFSVFLLFWKMILYYLTLRFGMRLDMGKIMLASLVLFPLGALYSFIMYWLGIFRIPFI